MIELRLLGENVALDRRIGGYVTAIQSSAIACAAGKIQSRARNSLIDRSDIEGDTEVTLAPASKVSKAEEEHRSGCAEMQLAAAGKRI